MQVYGNADVVGHDSYPIADYRAPVGVLEIEDAMFLG
jgi:hypothetical protein